MKKKLFFSLATVAAGLMAISTLGLPNAKVANADATTGWTCVNGGRAISTIQGGVRLVTDAWAVQHEKDDAFYLNGASFTFKNDSIASGQNSGFFFEPSKATGFAYSGPVFLIAHHKWTGQTRMLATADHNSDSGTSYWYASQESASPGCGGQASPQIVCNATATGTDGFTFKFDKISSTWWTVSITETVASTFWADTANYSLDQGTGLATVKLFIKNSDMTVAEDSTAFMEVYGFSGNVDILNFTNGTKWEQQAGPDKEGGKAAINSALAGVKRFEYSATNYSLIENAAAEAITSIDDCTTQAGVDSIVNGFKTVITNTPKIAYTAITDGFMSCTYGDCPERAVTGNADEKRYKMVTDAWPVTYTSGKKYAIDGLTMLFGAYNTSAASPVGFWFGQSASPTTGSGYGCEGAVVDIWQSRWGGQSRLAVVSNHDENSAQKCFTSMEATETGFGGAGANQLVLTDGNPTLVKIEFEHVKKAWWALHITETIYTTISYGTTNYVENQDGTHTATTYIKSADLPLDENGEAYLNVLGLNGNAIIQDFVPGENKELPEEPATPEEIAAFKLKIEDASAGYDEGYTALIATAKKEALDAIDAKTYPSEMEKICDDYKTAVVAGYKTYLGYDEVLEQYDPSGNFLPCWGAPELSKRYDNAGAVLLELKNEFGSRGQLVRQYDPLNFEMDINFSAASVDTALMVNFDTANQSYPSEATKYFHLEFLVRQNNKVHTIVGNTSSHNISIEGWDKVNDNTYTGTPVELGNSGNLHISISTDGNLNKTTIKMNEASLTVDTSVLNKGNDAPETPNAAFVQIGCINNSGTTKFLFSKIEDAASKEYAKFVANNSANIVTSVQQVCDAVVAEYGPYEDAGDAEFEAFQKAYEKGMAAIQEIQLTSYDVNYFLGDILAAFALKKTEIEADYADKLANAKLAVKAIFDDYPETDYREEEQGAIQLLKDNIDGILDECTSLADILTAGLALKVSLDELKTDKEYKDEEALADAKAFGCGILDALLDLADEDNITRIAKLIGDGKKAINAATTINDVEAITADYVDQINAILHEKDVVSIAVSGAKAEFTVGDTFVTDGLKVMATLNDGSVVDVTDKASIDSSAVDMASEGTYKIKVTYEGQEASYDVVVKAKVVPVDPTPTKGGCGSSILAASALVSCLAFAGVALVLNKKKED